MAKILCLCCGGIAESRHTHDFRQVPDCPNESFVDGGNAYTRIGGKDLSLIQVLDDREGPEGR